jgi:hypothetical protein
MRISLSIILFVVFGLAIYSEVGYEIASTIFSSLTNQFSEVFILFGFLVPSISLLLGWVNMDILNWVMKLLNILSFPILR